METTPVTPTITETLDLCYTNKLVHAIDGYTAGQTVEIGWSQDITYRGRVYTHRRITDRSDNSVQNQWFRVG